jgi:hypothetical protein
MNPYEFQELVGRLAACDGLTHRLDIPPGPDQGLDILAYTDPLGATGPRIKVQVKRRAERSTSMAFGPSWRCLEAKTSASSWQQGASLQKFIARFAVKRTAGLPSSTCSGFSTCGSRLRLGPRGGSPAPATESSAVSRASGVIGWPYVLHRLCKRWFWPCWSSVIQARSQRDGKSSAYCGSTSLRLARVEAPGYRRSDMAHAPQRRLCPTYEVGS